jgi:selenocysteine lyase/cysteine desulfurase
VIELIDESTAWVTLPGASNLLGTIPDMAPIIDAAHDAGGRVFVDTVYLAPHCPIDAAELGCDVLVASAYKWYGPHVGVLCAGPALLDELPVAKVRPAPDRGPRRWETGTPSFEAIAAVDAAAGFLLDEGTERLGAAEAVVFVPLLGGLLAVPGVRDSIVVGPWTRAPTVASTVDGRRPEEVAQALGTEHIALWSGHAYALEVVDQLGLAESGGVVRAGIAAYVDAEDVERLLREVSRLT